MQEDKDLIREACLGEVLEEPELVVTLESMATRVVCLTCREYTSSPFSLLEVGLCEKRQRIVPGAVNYCESGWRKAE